MATCVPLHKHHNCALYNKYLRRFTDSLLNAACSKYCMTRCVHRQTYGGRNEHTKLNLLKQRRLSGAPGPTETRGRCRVLELINPNNSRLHIGFISVRQGQTMLAFWSWGKAIIKSKYKNNIKLNAVLLACRCMPTMVCCALVQERFVLARKTWSCALGHDGIPLTH